MVTISGESNEILLLLKELVSKVKTLEDAVYNKDNILMKSGFVVVDTPTPAIRNEHTVNDISKMDWSQIHETINKMGWIDMPEKVTKEERVAEIAIEHAKKLLEVVKAKQEDSVVDAEVNELGDLDELDHLGEEEKVKRPTKNPSEEKPKMSKDANDGYIGDKPYFGWDSDVRCLKQE